MKKCSKCNLIKESIDFSKKTSTKDGLQTYCKICSKISQREFYAKNFDNVKDRKRLYRSTELYSEKSKYWEFNYRDRRSQKRKENFNITFGLIVRGMVRRCLKYTGTKKTIKTFDMLGYDTKKLKQRIECQFKDGMSWNNHGDWHIDHKKPITKFDKSTELRIINCLSNLQPLWKIENLSKGNKF